MDSADKEQLRKRFLSARKALDPCDRRKKSDRIVEHVLSLPEYISAGVVMVYCSIGSEVRTDELIRDMLISGKRVVLPCCSKEARKMNIAEITTPESDLVEGPFGTVEPAERLQGTVSGSEVELAICPGVAFDLFGTRLGRGKAYYDSFLVTLKNRVPITGLAFACQIYNQRLPTDSHDIPMDQIITESGPLLGDTVSQSFRAHDYRT
ncbi:MAG: 5-formyltetrahydrofolate cyclo-ligase [Chitinispirillaceae bacterium]